MVAGPLGANGLNRSRDRALCAGLSPHDSFNELSISTAEEIETKAIEGYQEARAHD
jgi:hypothetical protein